MSGLSSSSRHRKIRETTLEALRHSLSASRLSLKAQTHACQPGADGFHDMAEATDQMIGALGSLHETLISLNLALELRDIDIPLTSKPRELFRPPTQTTRRLIH